MPAFSSADPNAFLAMGMQSAQGTPQVSVAKLRYAKYLSGTNFDHQLEMQPMREGGDGLDFGFVYKKQQKVAGQVVINARPEMAAQLLQSALGGATWNGASLPAAHTFAAVASFPWSTLLIQHPGSDLAHMLSDTRFTGFTLEAQAGEPWKLTLPFVAITAGASFAAVTPTYFIEDPAIYHWNPSYVIDGAGDTGIESFKIEAGYGIEELQAQSLTLDDIVVQNREISVEFVRRYQNATLWKKIVMGAGITPTFSVASGSFDVFARPALGSPSYSLRFVLPLVDYFDDTISELDPDGKTVRETVTGKAMKGATTALIGYIANSHASAYGP